MAGKEPDTSMAKMAAAWSDSGPKAENGAPQTPAQIPEDVARLAMMGAMQQGAQIGEQRAAAAFRAAQDNLSPLRKLARAVQNEFGQGLEDWATGNVSPDDLPPALRPTPPKPSVPLRQRAQQARDSVDSAKQKVGHTISGIIGVWEILTHRNQPDTQPPNSDNIVIDVTAEDADN